MDDIEVDITVQHLRNLRRMLDIVPDHKHLLDRYIAVLSHESANQVNVNDAFSYGQLSSKMWLIAAVKELGLRLGRTWTLCGWIGTLGYLMFQDPESIGLQYVRSFDIDPRCADLAELMNKSAVINGWKFKAFTIDANALDYDAFEWSFWSKINNRMSHPINESADTVINTSCDHMGDDNTWWDRIPRGRHVILQNNNWHENDQHNNSVHDLTEFKRQYPMGELLFEGELDCTLYTRYMLIGRK